MATINLNNCPPDQRKVYSRVAAGAGKGDQPRNIWTTAFRRNYDRIFGARKQRTVTDSFLPPDPTCHTQKPPSSEHELLRAPVKHKVY